MKTANGFKYGAYVALAPILLLSFVLPGSLVLSSFFVFFILKSIVSLRAAATHEIDEEKLVKYSGKDSEAKRAYVIFSVMIIGFIIATIFFFIKTEGLLGLILTIFIATITLPTFFEEIVTIKRCQMENKPKGLTKRMKERNQSHNHPAFPQPNDTSISLWRYMDLNKFEWMVNEGRLFMPCADRLGDPFEGTTPKGELKWWLRQAENADSVEKKKIIEHNRSLISRMVKQFRNQYYVSCWHVNEFENYAMWQCYTKDSNAVAIRSSYKTLRACLLSYVVCHAL